MCGIIGYIGNEEAAPILHKGLKRLEYRGYDSAGIATASNSLKIKKDEGKIDEIDDRLSLSDMKGKTGIGHTRWATHGKPSKRNAHPHTDGEGDIAVVHNGIIENYKENKEFLKNKGYKFSSETDTEVIPHLIDYYQEEGKSLRDAVRLAAERLEGSYALGIISAKNPDEIIVVREQSPLIIGVGDGENYVASDIPAILPHTKKNIILENGEMAIIKRDEVKVLEIKTGNTIKKEIREADWSAEMAEKGGYEHFMLKEINEQPNAIRNTLRVSENELDELLKMIEKAEDVYLVACGTSYHAALVGKYALAKLSDISVESVISSEFQESVVPKEGDMVLAITQSGETADTLKAMRVAKENGAKLATLTNTVGSSATRKSDLSCLIRAGPEIGVAATKTFTSQVAYLLRFACYASKENGNLTRKEYEEKVSQLKKIPDIQERIVETTESKVEELAKDFASTSRSYFIGRGIGYPIAMEGSLKLKEIAYIHSEAHPAGELKHGPLALIEEGIPVFALVTPGPSRERMAGNMEEVKARGAKVVALLPEGNQEVREQAQKIISLPKLPELLSPLVYIIPLQLLSYYIGVERGHDPDKPRHLAKSVTVE